MAVKHAWTVAEFVAWAIERSGRTQKELAREIGFERPNILSMIKTGETKLPLERIPEVATALEVDPAYLMRLALCEYEPELFGIIVHTLGKPLTRNEQAVVEAYRRIAPLDDVEITDDAQAQLMLTIDSMRMFPWPRRRGR
jgi:transcriptional regulator with XRE-family HTH domain